MARYLVTGGAGFIGSHLVEALHSDGHAVAVLDDLSTGRRENLPADAPLVVDDINRIGAHPDLWRGLDGCFHLAAVASVQRGTEDWAGCHDVNARGTIAVFEAARDHGVPVVYASSAAVYGDPIALPQAEDALLRPLTAYGADKLASELHARVAGGVHGVPTHGLRFFNVYGPRQDPRSPYSGVVSVFCDRLLADRPIVVHGDGAQSRDFVAVADVVRALRAALGAAALDAPVTNVCTGRSTSVLELSHTLARVIGVTPRVSHGPARVGDIRHSVGDPARLHETLGMTAETPLAEGLAALVAWARATAPA
ncbi:NAD-dependent epimerase/dehydratase family protein [Roseospira goensis]|uniref:UDP-glucose 4-epimerase n=1 Tax=Roseospira goensis TaxID=391922 RepID=A0A7W6RXI9_9PROT|nr:NAD-dependent epimerase/dehydratase family protein [Roseospira goensis]MBB4284412.1 UDP-glucose 4-epimerase [Roseospira goensis]